MICWFFACLFCNRKSPFNLVPRGDYKVDEKFVYIQTESLGQFICSSSGCPRVCEGKAQAFLFGTKSSSQSSTFSLRVYGCSPLYNIPEFRKVKLLLKFTNMLFHNKTKLYFAKVAEEDCLLRLCNS